MFSAASPTPGKSSSATTPSRKRWRKRRTRPRGQTIHLRGTPVATRQRLIGDGSRDYPHDVERPVTRDDCRDPTMRPCPFVSCKHHLYLDVNPSTGSIKINFPDVEVENMRNSCALDIAERGGITLEDVGEVMNLTRERIRQIETRGLLKLKFGIPRDVENGEVDEQDEGYKALVAGVNFDLIARLQARARGDGYDD